MQGLKSIISYIWRDVYDQENTLSCLQIKCEDKQNGKKNPNNLPDSSEKVEDLLQQALTSLEEKQQPPQIEEDLDLFSLIDTEDFSETDYNSEAGTDNVKTTIIFRPYPPSQWILKKMKHFKQIPSH